MEQLNFSSRFKSLTKQETGPLSWQSRLFEEWFGKGQFPCVIDLPTGMGKTMVMAIWLIAREANPELPRRLIYVVDRRTVVDQATDIAKRLVARFGESGLSGPSPAISTLRGQLADEREWSRDPSRPAIIIGTVDLIGSGLLFSGYRSGYKTRPLQAGFFGQDSLLVLDEAHLSKPFEQLLVGQLRDGKHENGISHFQAGHGLPMKVICMSATSGESTSKRTFTLQFDEAGELAGEDASDPVVKERFESTRSLAVKSAVEPNKLNDALASAAITLAADPKAIGKRIVVFVRSPNDATDIAKKIREHEVKSETDSGKKPKTIKSKPFEYSVKILTGTMRGLERDELVETSILRRFLEGDILPSDAANQLPAFLVSTSAGEVGFDLNADHMVCDIAPIDSMIQRLGRVNRRGKGNAQIVLIPSVIKESDSDGKTRKLTPLDQAIKKTHDLFKDRTDVSPRAIARLKATEWKSLYAAACSPPPTMVDLTDILLDNWSMTSISERIPGRPDVAPWLRGIDDEAPQTMIVWRAELDLPEFNNLDLETIGEWFDAHNIRTHETLTVPTSAASTWLLERWRKLNHTDGKEHSDFTVIIDRAGLTKISIKEVVKQLERKDSSSIRNSDLILPSSFGGIERHEGLLKADAPKVADDEQNKSLTERTAAALERLNAPDVADERERYRELVTNTDGIKEETTIGSGTKPAHGTYARLSIELTSDENKTVRLVSYVPKYEKPEVGSEKQTLAMHVDLVCKRMRDILDRLSVSEAVRKAAQLAAEYHDHGKNRERWQRTVGGKATIGTEWQRQVELFGDGSDQSLGKSGGEMRRDPRGYRHEFGSLREFVDAKREAVFTDSKGDDITQQVMDLALHMIAVHHGRGRPHFPKGGFDPDAESRSMEVHTNTIRRFARLQREYGYWQLAWLENLLRCADALASTNPDVDEPLDLEGEN